MDRIKELIGNMTLEEKVSQLGSVPVRILFENDKLSEEKMRKYLGNGIGQITRAYGGFKDKDIKEVGEYVKRIKKFFET